MGFLDAKDRIVDFVLTERGRQLFALGALDFTFFAVFDDGIDYDPWSAESPDDDGRQAMIESTAMFEAPSIPIPQATSSSLEPSSHVFTAADGFVVIPKIDPSVTASLALHCTQVAGNSSKYFRRDSNHAFLPLRLIGDVEPHLGGFEITVFVSGSPGLQELVPKTDSELRRCFDPFLACTVDGETKRNG